MTTAREFLDSILFTVSELRKLTDEQLEAVKEDLSEVDSGLGTAHDSVKEGL